LFRVDHRHTTPGCNRTVPSKACLCTSAKKPWLMRGGHTQLTWMCPVADRHD
jgi:hypothetical protein